MRARVLASLLFLLACRGAQAQAQPADHGSAGRAGFSLLDVPFLSQSEALCGGAAAAMVLRYWGARGLDAESFAHLLDRSAGGIATTTLVADLRDRGWDATAIAGTAALVDEELARGRPVLALIEDRPGTFHYVVAVAAHAAAIVFHDPARSPYRVMPRTEFARRWRAAGQWMAVVVPGPRGRDGASGRSPEASAASAASTTPSLLRPSQPCDRLIATGVERAQANDLAGAEVALAEALSCPGAAPLRELAGLRLLQQRWPEVAELSMAALDRDPRDAHARRLLATSRFLQNEAPAALDAWNAVGEPRLDLVSVDGLARTRHRVVERLMRLRQEELLTRAGLARASRRLGELPAAITTRLEYVPRPGGVADVHARVFERPLLPRTVWSYVALGLTAATSRDAGLVMGSPSGGGEKVSAGWRFWPNRPRVGLGVQVPVGWGGVWDVTTFAERQPFDDPSIETSRRTSARLTASDWLTAGARLSVRGGVDRWADRGAFAVAGGGVRLAGGRPSRNNVPPTADRVDARLDIDAWTGADVFWITAGSIRLRSSASQRGIVVTGRVDAGAASRRAPLDRWLSGDTGQVRPVLLRAHSAVDAGRLVTARLGRTLLAQTVEIQRWWGTALPVRIAGAAFVDTVQVRKRLEAGSRRDVDVGAGVRLALASLPGVVRIDAAKGLRDGATRLSFVYEP